MCELTRRDVWTGSTYVLARAVRVEAPITAKRLPMHILIIDDDKNLRRSLRLALETLGHQVTEASDGEKASALLGHTMFDVAFLDLRLFREEGLDLLPELLRLA